MAAEPNDRVLRAYTSCANVGVCHQRAPVWLLTHQKGCCTKCFTLFGEPLARHRNQTCVLCEQKCTAFKCPLHQRHVCEVCAHAQTDLWPALIPVPLDPRPDEPAGLGALGSVATWVTTNNTILAHWVPPQHCLLCNLSLKTELQ